MHIYFLTNLIFPNAYQCVFLVVFTFFEKNYLLLSYATSDRLSVRLSTEEINSFRGNLISNMPIDLKFGQIVGYGVVHVRKA